MYIYMVKCIHENTHNGFSWVIWDQITCLLYSQMLQGIVFKKKKILLHNLHVIIKTRTLTSIFSYFWQPWVLTQGFTFARQILLLIPSPVLVGCFFFFQIGSCKLFAGAWLWTTILLISASWVAGITVVSTSAWSLVHFQFLSITIVPFSTAWVS
jgi:hypothetical protein